MKTEEIHIKISKTLKTKFERVCNAEKTTLQQALENFMLKEVKRRSKPKKKKVILPEIPKFGNWLDNIVPINIEIPKGMTFSREQMYEDNPINEL